MRWIAREKSALWRRLGLSLDRLDDKGCQTVPLYTLRFFLDGDAPAGSEEIDCASDAEAINAVNDRADSRAIELWQGERMILWWPAQRRLPTRRRGPRTPFPR